MKEKKTSLPFIVLAGDSQENYYRLGIKDRKHYDKIINPRKNLTPGEKINLLFYKGLKVPAYTVLKRHPAFAKVVRAYSEGLKIRSTEFAALILGTEWASIGRIRPFISFRSHFFGVSCFYRKGMNTCMMGSIPFLRGTDIDGKERSILYKFHKRPVIFSCNTIGSPWPSFFAMNDKGLTLSFFQGGTGGFHLTGMPIFEIIDQILISNMTQKAALCFLKKTNTIGSWKINLGFSNGKILSAHMKGEEKSFENFDLTKKNIILLGNTPKGFFFEKKGTPSKNPNHLKIFDFMNKTSTNKIHSEKNLDVGKFSCYSCLFDPMGLTFSRQGQKNLYLSGSYESLSDIWTKPIMELKRNKQSQEELNYRKGIQAFLSSQACFAKKDWHPAYHHIQMAIAILKGRPEESICQFYFLLFEFINNHSKKTHLRLLAEFEKLPDKLPNTLKKHCLLFIWRIKYILKVDTVKDREGIDKKIFIIESKIPRIFLPLFVEKSLLPAESFLNIFYTHQLINFKGE